MALLLQKPSEHICDCIRVDAPVSSVDVLARLLVCEHGLDRKEELSTSAGAGSLSSLKSYRFAVW